MEDASNVTTLVTKSATDIHLDVARNDRTNLSNLRSVYEERISHAYKVINETEPKLKETITLQQITEDRINNLERSKING